MSASEQPKSRAKAVLEWLWRGRALRQARDEACRTTAEQKELYRRASTTFEMATHALAPELSPDSGAAAIAAELFRQAAYWALLGQKPGLGRPAPDALWEASDQGILLEAAGSAEVLARVRSLAWAGFVDFADRPSTEQRMVAHDLESFASRLIDAGRRPLARVEEVRIQRLFGVLFVAAFVIVVAAGATAGVRRLTKRPNLALGKPWTASSEFAKCHPEKSECGGAVTDMFFSTKNEENPWFEYDLGGPVRFSSMTIVNRTDCCADRAVPLIVQVSNDRKTWAEVARRTEIFDTWRPKFPVPQQARFVRLTVPRVTHLHLEAVELHP